MFWQLVLTAAVLGTAYYRWSRRRLYRLAVEIPCIPNCYPIIGNALMFTGSSKDRMNSIEKIGRTSNQQGGLASLWLGRRLFVCLTDPAAIAVVSKACLDKEEITRKVTKVAVGNGSIMAPVNIWRPRRKINSPFFSLKNLNTIVAVLDQQSTTMVDLIKAEVGGGEFSIWKYITTFTFDSVGETAIGIKIKSQENQDHYLLQAIDECCQMLSKRILQPWLHSDFVYKNLAIHKLFQHEVQNINSFIDEGTTIKMMVAGTDTSATAVSFTAVLVSRYPEVQEKIHQELQDMFGDSDRPVTAEDLTRLRYLEAVIKESLRLYPPIPVVVREVHEDIVLPTGSTLVDGTAILLNIWGTHRNPAYWGADAELFRPERFLVGALCHPAMFVPFSYSVRNCVGATYAMLSAKTALANTLRRYRLLPPDAPACGRTRELPVKFDIMIKAVDGFLVRLEQKKL